MNEKYSRGGEFIENMVTDNIIEFCKRWFHLAGINELLEDIEEFNKKYRICYSSSGVYGKYIYNENGLHMCPVYDMREIKTKSPIYFDNRNIAHKPVIFYKDMKNSGVK